MTEYKRQFRELPDETKQKISLSSKGKKKSEQHKERIRQAMLDYWKTIPHKPTSGEIQNTTYQSEMCNKNNAGKIMRNDDI